VCCHECVSTTLAGLVGWPTRLTLTMACLELIVAPAADHAAVSKAAQQEAASPAAADGPEAESMSSANVSEPEQSPDQPMGGQTCVICGASFPRLKKCGGCLQRLYCGQVCQAAHWPAHKAECKRMQKKAKAAAEAAGNDSWLE